MKRRLRKIEADRRAKLKLKVKVIYCRVMLLGPGGVGKTSLKRGLMGLRLDDAANSTIVADVHSLTVNKGNIAGGMGLEGPLDPLEREWVSGAISNRWREVTEEDEINELAKLIAYVVDDDDDDSGDSDEDFVEVVQGVPDGSGASMDCGAIKVLMDSRILNEAFKRAGKLKSDNMPCPEASPYFHLWDCGGQPVFQEVLPVFLTARTMFLLLFNATKDLDANIELVQYHLGKEIKRGDVNMTTLQLLEGWMSNIHSYLLRKDRSGCLLEYPRVIPVGTRGDALNNEERKRVLEYLMKSSYDKIFSEVLKQPVIIDNTTAGKDAEEDPIYQVLRGAISNFATRRLTKKTPITWVLYRKVLQLITTEDSSTNTITLDEASAIGIVCNIHPDRVPDVLKFYHELGVLLYYPEIEGLRDKIILNPKWFVDCLGMVLTLPGVGKEETEREVQWNLFRNTGILVQPLYAAVWKECKGVEPESMIQLLASFQLAVKVETELYFGQRVPQFFVPAVLPYYRTSDDHLTCQESEGPAPLHIKFKSGYVTPGFFTRFVTEFAKQTRCKLYFDDGIYHNRVTYRFGDTAANLVTFTELLNVISVHVCRLGPDMPSDLQKDCLELKSLCVKCSLSVEKCLQPNTAEHSSKMPQVICQNPSCVSTKQPTHYLEHDIIKMEVCCSNDIRTYRRITRTEACWYKDVDMSEFRNTDSTSSVEGYDKNDKPDPIHVFRLLQSKAFEWDAIGRELGVPHPFREDLRREGIMSTNDGKLEKVINKWVESECSEVSWNSLMKALKRLEYISLVKSVKQYLMTDPVARKKYNWEDPSTVPPPAVLTDTDPPEEDTEDDSMFVSVVSSPQLVTETRELMITTSDQCQLSLIPEASDVFHLLQSNSSLWNDFGREAGIADSLMEKLQREKQTDDAIVLGEWLKSADASWDGVIRILDELQLSSSAEQVKVYLLTDNQAIAKYRWKESEYAYH